MYFDARWPLSRAVRGIALAAACALLLLQVGCDTGEPLEAIRQRQAGGDFEGSIGPLRDLLAENPDDPEANFLYGKALVVTHRPNLATWPLRKAVQHPEWRVRAGIALARLAFVAGEFDEVVEVTGRILEREPDQLQALLLRAGAHARWKKDPERALADAERVLALDPDALAAYEPRVLALLALGRAGEAREVFAEAGRRLREQDTEPHVLAWHCSATAALHQQAGEIEQARGTWAGCLEAHPGDVGVVSGAMSFHDAQGELDASLEIARAALEHDPASQPFRTTLANRLAVAGRLAEAEAVMREATDSPEPAASATAWLELAQHRRALGEPAASADALEQGLERLRVLGPVPVRLEFDYADTLVLAGRLERALEVAESLTVPAYRHAIRARVAQERRQPARALEEFEAGIRLWPDNPYLRYYAASAAEELGDFDRALEELRYAVRNGPAATDARARGARLLLAQNEPRQAIHLLSTGIGRGEPLELEAQLLGIRIHGYLGNGAAARAAVAALERAYPAWVGRAWAEAAEGRAEVAGAAPSLALLASLPADLYEQPRFADALRVYVRLGHASGDAEGARANLRAALAASPESAALEEIRGLDLELSGAATDEVRAAYARAAELEVGNARALAGLGRLSLPDDPRGALAFFDRAAAADPSDAEPKLQAARALAADGDLDGAVARLDTLLLEHPYHAEAAAEQVRLDLVREQATARTVERARRAVRFGGGVDALELLSQVHRRRGEEQAAARAAQRARALREQEAAG